MENEIEFKRLLELEFGDIGEVATRIIGVPVTAIALYIYGFGAMSLLWMSIYLAANLMYFLYLRSEFALAWQSGLRVAQVLYLAILASFLWVPAWMFVQMDMNLTFAGAALLGCLLVCLIKRNEVSRFMIVSQSLLIVAALVAMISVIFPKIDGGLGQFGVIASWIALVGYFYRSMMKSREGILAERDAREQAERSQKLASIGQLAGGVAHDFNNSLTAISGNLELYEVIEDRNEQDTFVQAAKAASAQASSIVKQLLEYARENPRTLVPLDANHPLDSLTLLTSHLIAPNIDIEMRPLDHAVGIKVDRNQLTTALVNLIVNGADAMPDGGKMQIRIDALTISIPQTVAGGTVLARGDYVAYRVKDTGHGIPAEMLDNVLTPFFTTKGPGQGTGLGLPMVHSLVEELEGGLEIESTLEGTTVSMLVPILPNYACV